MQAQNHYAYEEELKNVKDTCSTLDQEIDFMIDEVNKFEESFRKLKASAGGNYSDEVVVKREINEAMKRKLKELKRIKQKPYFGRIDFKELGKDRTETLYIGKTSLVRRQDDKRLIVDWRAPIASLYYSGEIGDVMYTAPGGLIMGDLEIKRQYEIDNRELLNIFDKGITPMDEYLQSALWEKKDNRLRDIVTTIQSEQNDIIRADRGKALIVQGVAGSGKTTIVLHRIAYLMYTYQDMFAPDKLLIVVPNRLFLNYISDVLPDLGVEEINQFTFEDLAMKILGREYDLLDIEYKLLKLLDYKEITEENRDKLRLTSIFKGSMFFKEIIDKYIKDLTESFVPETDFKVNDYMMYSYSDIKTMFDSDYSYLPLIQRVKRIRKYIEFNMKVRLESIESEIMKSYEGKVRRIKSKKLSEEELKEELIRVYDERDEMISQLKSAAPSELNQYLKLWPTIDIDEIYREMVGNYEVLNKYNDGTISQSDMEYVAKYSKNVFLKDKIEREDLVPLIYLNMRLIGTDLKGRFNHIVVDEAQDYSQFQMYILKQLSSNSSFTIVGDLSQGIYSYKGIQDWNELMKEVFSGEEKDFLTLKKCYRSTMEIMNLANQVIKRYRKGNVTLAEPVLRMGEKPVVINKSSHKEMIDDIIEKIGKLRKEGSKSVAIIAKTEEESYKIYSSLKDSNIDNLHLITDKDTEYTGGIVVIPVYMAKGLEFDAVVIYDCSKENYIEDELHIKLLYVAMTRPLHKLYIYYRKQPSELIREVMKEKELVILE